MNRERLVGALAKDMPEALATDLVDGFLQIRHDAATRTLGGGAPGRFIETVVQILQFRTKATFDTHPKVEDYLKNRVEQETSLDDGLRICAARVARATYSLRNKRNIAHKQPIDSNSYDLRLIHAAAQWIMAELLRLTAGLGMEEAGALIELVHVPIGSLVEEIDGRRLVHGDFSTAEEIIVLLHSHFPDHVPTSDLLESLDRRNAASVRARLADLYRAKLVQGGRGPGYRLTAPGFDRAIELINAAVKS